MVPIMPVRLEYPAWMLKKRVSLGLEVLIPLNQLNELLDEYKEKRDVDGRGRGPERGGWGE